MKRISIFLAVLVLIVLGVFIGCPEEPVDKSSLTSAITAAETNKDSVGVSTDGADVNPTEKWVTQGALDTYAAAIAAAKVVKNNANATQAEVNEAVTVLTAATTAFNNAKADGTKLPVQNETQSKGYATIQEAIDEAEEGDTILVAPGTYTEALTLSVKGLTLESVGGRDTTIIDADGADVAVMIGAAGLGTITFDGFTVQGWGVSGIVQPMGRGGAGSAFHVLNNRVIVPESVPSHGNSIQVSGDNSIVRGNIVDTTTIDADWSASGILVYRAKGVLVEENEVGGASVGISVGGGLYAQPKAEDNTIQNNTIGNTGVGIAVEGEVEGTLIEGNTIAGSATGIRIFSHSSKIPTDTTITDNEISDVDFGVRLGSFDTTALPVVDLEEVLSENTFPEGFIVIVNEIAEPENIEVTNTGLYSVDARPAVYLLYTVDIDADPDDTEVHYYRPNGVYSELEVLDEPEGILNIYLRMNSGVGNFEQQEGTHIFYIKKDNKWYKATIDYDHSLSKFILNTSSATLVEFNGDDATVEIPNGVVAIGDEAFKENTDLVSVSIPASVTAIGEKAFYAATNLESVIFRGTSGLTTIGDQAFEQCESLESITIPASVTTMGEGAFAGLTALTSLTIPEGVTAIPEGAFADTNALTTLVLPDSVTEIGIGAFFNTISLTSITIGANVTGVDVGSINFVRDGDFSSIGFIEVYDSNSKAAGTYTYDGSVWSKEI